MPNINRGVEILHVCLPVSPALTGSSSVHHLLRASPQKHTDVCLYQLPEASQTALCGATSF